MDGERSEGVLVMAASTKQFPTMDISIIGTFRAEFMIMITSGIKQILAICEMFSTVELMVPVSLKWFMLEHVGNLARSCPAVFKIKPTPKNAYYSFLFEIKCQFKMVNSI